MLAGVAVAHHGLLDLHGLVFINGDTGLLHGKQDNAPRLGNVDAGGNVVPEEQLLNGHGIRLFRQKQLHHVVINNAQPPVKIRVGGCGDGAAPEKLALPALGMDNAEAGDAIAGVNAENLHSLPR